MEEDAAPSRSSLIRGAYLITMDDEMGAIQHGDVLIADGLIADVGENLSTADAEEVIDGTDRIVLPGFVDGHRHMFSGILRGCAADTQGSTYFDRVISRYAVSFTPQDTYVSVRLGMAEAVFAGTTTMHAWEHNLFTPAHADSSLKALHESGMRGRFSYGPRNDTMFVDTDDVLRLRSEQFTRRDNGSFLTDDGLLHLGLATRGVELSRPEIWTKEFAFAREEQLPLTAHVMARNISEMSDAEALGPDVLSVHANDATPDEIAYLARSRTPVCIAPSAIARSAIGYSPVVELMAAGVPVCLSVDSIAACDAADMFGVMRFTLLSERMRHHDVSVYTPEDALRQATIEGAKALGLGDVSGSLTIGKRADLIVLRANDLNMAPMNVPETQVVLAALPHNVEFVYIDGICRKRDGKLVGIDTAKLAAEAKQAVLGLSDRVGERVH